MKKLIVLTLVLLTSATMYGLPLGNPAEPGLLRTGIFFEEYDFDDQECGCGWLDSLNFRLGFYGDYVFDRKLHVRQGETAGDNIEKTEIFTNAVYLAGNFWEHFDLFATLGASNLYIDTNAFSFFAPTAGGANGSRIVIESGTNFSWSIGARAILYQCGAATLGIEGQYFKTHPTMKRFTYASTTSTYTDDFINMAYSEYQFGIGISYRIWNFVPYFGTKYSRGFIDFNERTSGTTTFNDLRTRHNGGLVLGVTLVDCDRALLTVETRFPDEKAIYVNSQFRF